MYVSYDIEKVIENKHKLGLENACDKFLSQGSYSLFFTKEILSFMIEEYL